MWPFKTSSDDQKSLNFRQIDPQFATAPQLLPEQVEAVAAAGFKTILCARPDDEQPGQPSFDAIARAAQANGLAAVHIPISGSITEGALIRMEEALRDLPTPIYGYCRSGGRAGSLYAAARQAGS